MSNKEMKNLSDYYVKKKQGVNNADGFLKVDENGEVFVSTGIVIPDSAIVDDTLDTESTHAVQNKVINSALDGKVDKAQGSANRNMSIETNENGNIVCKKRDGSISDDIQMNGSQSMGNSQYFARADHIHPHDDTKLNINDPSVVKYDNKNYGIGSDTSLTINTGTCTGTTNRIIIHKIGNICIADIYLTLKDLPNANTGYTVTSNAVENSILPTRRTGQIVKSAGSGTNFFYFYIEAPNNTNAGKFVVSPYKSGTGGVITCTMCWFCGGQ